MTAEIRLRAVTDVLRRSGLLQESRTPGDLSVSGVSQDSRRVEPGDLFLAWKGTAADGHEFLAAAREAGARAAVVERFVEDDPLPQIRVSDGRTAAALVAHEVAGRPTDRLRVAAVTGTNGKTTVAYLARQLLARSGPAASIGTLGTIGADGARLPGGSGLTTPGPVELAERLDELARGGIAWVVLEASSHALEQHRLDGLAVDAACFTNLSRDHLDYHETHERYLAAKARLVDLLREGGAGGAVVNGNDPAWAGLPDIRGDLLVTRIQPGEPAEGAGASTADRASSPPAAGGSARDRIPSARRRLPDVVVDRVRLGADGSRFRVRRDGRTLEVHLPLLGAFNVENAVAALGIALLAGVPLEEAAAGLARVSPPPGRLEVTVREPVPVILDFAHTPDALRNVLAALRPLHPGRLIAVFGAGGDRDRTKRAPMGRAAVEGADKVIVTSDNPRTEDPERIIDEIVEGMAGAPHHRESDRRSAIAMALEMARPGDAVLLAGKGHETQQIVGTESRLFDERAMVREILGSKEGA